MKQRLICLVAIILFASPLHAHTGLGDSVPSDGQVLAQLPEQLILEFTAPVMLANLKLFDAQGNAVPLGFSPQGKPQQAYRFEWPPLDAGSYRVEWRALGSDGHTVEGQISFEIAP